MSEKIKLAEYAKRYNVSQEAVRQKIFRGGLKTAEKREGRWYVDPSESYHSAQIPATAPPITTREEKYGRAVAILRYVEENLPPFGEKNVMTAERNLTVHPYDFFTALESRVIATRNEEGHWSPLLRDLENELIEIVASFDFDEFCDNSPLGEMYIYWKDVQYIELKQKYDARTVKRRAWIAEKKREEDENGEKYDKESQGRENDIGED